MGSVPSVTVRPRVRYAIIGCGTGGPAAALLLRRQGHEVVVFERVSVPRPVGAGLLLQPTGLFVLAQLGLLNRVLGHGDRIARLLGTSRGRAVIDLEYQGLGSDRFGLGITRAALFSALWDAMKAEGIEVRTGVEVDRLHEGPGCVTIGGDSFDRVVVADGARSRLRPPWARVDRYPWGALWFLADAPEFPRDTLRQFFRDTRQFVGFLPSGDGQISVFWSLRADAVDAWRARGVGAWKEQILALAPDAPLDGLHDVDQVVFAPYFDVRMPRWHTGRIVWIGDAAHAMSPQLGQGANLALWDAWTLASVRDLADYSRVRTDHLRFYQFATRWLTPFFQSSIPLLAPLRDLGAPLFHAWPWYRRQMLLTLAGVKTGPIAAMPIP